MARIKLQRLPDRTPVKLTISVSPELAQTLSDYADFYARAYDAAEPLTQLIPAMLEAFLRGDREFARSRKASENCTGTRPG